MNPFGNGWHLDRAAFDQALRDRVTAISINNKGRRKVIHGKFKSVHKGENKMGWVATLDIAEDEELVLNAKWIIDATGRKASVATKVCRDLILSQL